MRLSDIKGEKCFEVVAEIIPPLLNIASDDNALELFKPQDTPKGMTPQKFFISRLQKGLPALLVDHKEDFIVIVATLNDQTKEEYVKTMTLPKLINDVFSIMADEELKVFLS